MAEQLEEHGFCSPFGYGAGPVLLERAWWSHHVKSISFSHLYFIAYCVGLLAPRFHSNRGFLLPEFRAHFAVLLLIDLNK